jgi:hypothetical protein
MTGTIVMPAQAGTHYKEPRGNSANTVQWIPARRPTAVRNKFILITKLDENPNRHTGLDPVSIETKL